MSQDDRIALLEAEIKRYQNVLKNIDFKIDEFSIGLCRIDSNPTIEDYEKLPEAIEELFVVLLRKSARLYNVKRILTLAETATDLRNLIEIAINEADKI